MDVYISTPSLLRPARNAADPPSSPLASPPLPPVPFSLPLPPVLRSSLGLYKIFFYFESFVHESIVLSFSRPACIAHTVAILLHDYSAIYDPPSNSLWYAIHHTILVITISCKGQLPTLPFGLTHLPHSTSTERTTPAITVSVS